MEMGMAIPVTIKHDPNMQPNQGQKQLMIVILWPTLMPMGTNQTFRICTPPLYMWPIFGEFLLDFTSIPHQLI